jgi:hypothetical protein
MFIVFGFVGSTWEGQLQKKSYKFYRKKNANLISINIPTIAILKFLPLLWEWNFQCI